MIESVRKREVPIESLKVLNPHIPMHFPADKTVVLDIRVKLRNGHQLDLEMQATNPPGTRARFLYYWARAFADTLGIGEDFTKLRTCISILWMKAQLLSSQRFHSVVHLSEDHCRDVFSPETVPNCRNHVVCRCASGRNPADIVLRISHDGCG